MSVAVDRTQKLRSALSSLERGSSLIARTRGIDMEHVRGSVGEARLGERVGIAGPELGTASERIRAARAEQEKPNLQPLDVAADTPEATQRPDLGQGHDL